MILCIESFRIWSKSLSQAARDRCRLKLVLEDKAREDEMLSD
jgi:hypothetical protein